MTSITALPTELINKIYSHLPIITDVISCALTCSRLYNATQGYITTYARNEIDEEICQIKLRKSILPQFNERYSNNENADSLINRLTDSHLKRPKFSINISNQ